MSWGKHMKKLYAIVLTGAVLSGLGLIQPGVSSAAPDCNNQVWGAVTLAGNLRVTGTCDLTGTLVTGSITVVPGGSLTMTNATVNGSVTQTGGTLVARNSTIRGSVTVTETADNSQNDICGGSIGGSVTVSDATGPATGWFRLLGKGAVIPTGACAAPFVVNPLTIGGTVTFNGNVIYVRVSKATVSGSVKVTNNMSLAYDNPADVSGNVIKGSLSCSGNVVPGPTGGPATNTVTGTRTGQCAGF